MNPVFDQILLAVSDNQIYLMMERVLRSMGYTVKAVQERGAILNTLKQGATSLVVLSEPFEGGSGVQLAGELVREHPTIPVVLFLQAETVELLKEAIGAGVAGVLTLPLSAGDIHRVVDASLSMARTRREEIVREANRRTMVIQHQVNELESLTRLMRLITSALDTNEALTQVVSAAVELTGAEQGSLQLLDKSTGTLYMRAAKNIDDNMVRTFRIPANDSVAGTVLSTRKPLMFDSFTPKKIVTSYMVQSLLYVPLMMDGEAIGVLGVDNRRKPSRFSDSMVKQMSALADISVIALENARQFTELVREKGTLTALLDGIKDGVILLDISKNLLLVNRIVRDLFNLHGVELEGKPVAEVIHHEEIQRLLSLGPQSEDVRSLIHLERGQSFTIRISPIPGIGSAILLSDMTSYESLASVKNEFVDAISEDIRQPVSTMLKNTELIQQAGSLNAVQEDLLRQLRKSGNELIVLIDDLMSLGRIRAGFYARKEPISLNEALLDAAETTRKRYEHNRPKVTFDFNPESIMIYANMVLIRMLFENLLDHVYRNTPESGKIEINLHTERDLVVLKVNHEGAGFSQLDLPFIFDQFYPLRQPDGSSVSSGLELTIVKVIGDTLNGKIWVDSTFGKGTSFTVILPRTQEEKNS